MRTHARAPHEDVHRLLKGALRERPVPVAVDAVACDGHEVAARRHDIAQDGQVPAWYARGRGCV